MKKVFEGKIIDVLPVDSGIVFAYLFEGEQSLVSYKMVTFETGKITDSPKSVYRFAKFGPNFKILGLEPAEFLLSKTVHMPNNKVFILLPDGTARVIDSAGETVWEGTLTYKKSAPSSIAFNNRNIWACFKENGIMMRLNINTFREELRIGGGKDSPFSEPEDLYIEDDCIYVSNKGANNILKVNTSTYVIEEFKNFDFPVLKYFKHAGYEFAVLANGIYLL